MFSFDQIPWNSIATQLRDEADRHSGTPGAILGAGLGAATVIAGMQAAHQKITPVAILSGALVGMAYGAADKKRLGNS